MYYSYVKHYNITMYTHICNTYICITYLLISTQIFNLYVYPNFNTNAIYNFILMYTNFYQSLLIIIYMYYIILYLYNKLTTLDYNFYKMLTI